jgi:hypothetical protein
MLHYLTQRSDEKPLDRCSPGGYLFVIQLCIMAYSSIPSNETSQPGSYGCAYSDDVDGRFQRDVNGHSGHVNKVGARYPKPSRSQQVRDKVNEIFGGVK